jgi:hypothetical protein
MRGIMRTHGRGARGLRGALVVCALLAASGRAAIAQRGIPATAFGASDLAKMRWIEGYWRGSATGERPFYERYQFVNDSTIEITYYADSAFSRTTGGGRVYVSVGRVYHTSGAARWGAAHVGADGIYFIPQQNASNTFTWTYRSPDEWIATLRTSGTGQERVTTYEMRRITR